MQSLAEPIPLAIKATHEFQKKVRSLTKKYRHIRSDLQPILEKLSRGEELGDRISGINAIVYKLRVKNSDTLRFKKSSLILNNEPVLKFY